MKKTSLLLVLLFFFASFSQAQSISERTDGLVIIGADLFTDFNTGESYDNFNLRPSAGPRPRFGLRGRLPGQQPPAA